MSIQGFFIGLILIILGTLGIKFNYQITNNLGTMESVERFLGPGRQYAFYKLLGILFIIVGFFVMFGVFNDILNFIFTPLRNALSR
jgi:hypothetical protein